MVHPVLKRLLILLAIPSVGWASGIYNPGSTGGGGTGSGTVNSGTQNQVAYYAAAGSSNAVSGSSVIKVFASSAAATGILDMSSNKVVNVADSASSGDAVNLSQLANVASANAIINGNFQFWQRGTSFTNQPAGTYLADRWQFDPLVALGGSWTVSQNFATVNQSTSSVRVQVATFQSNTRYALFQPIENFYDYVGTSVTLTAFVNSNLAATIGIRDSIGTSTSAAHPADSAWHQLTVTRFISSTATSLGVVLGLNNYNSNTSQYYDNVMLVPGDAPINYVPRPTAIEYAMCQRYFRVLGTGVSGEFIPTGNPAQAYDSTHAQILVAYPGMRTTPAITVNNATHFSVGKSDANNQACTAFSANVTGTTVAQMLCTVASGLTAGNSTFLTTSNADATIFISAEM